MSEAAASRSAPVLFQANIPARSHRHLTWPPFDRDTTSISRSPFWRQPTRLARVCATRRIDQVGNIDQVGSREAWVRHRVWRFGAAARRFGRIVDAGWRIDAFRCGAVVWRPLSFSSGLVVTDGDRCAAGNGRRRCCGYSGDHGKYAATRRARGLECFRGCGVACGAFVSGVGVWFVAAGWCR